MKATEAAALLTIAAAYDNRKPDADQAKAWAVSLDGYRFEDCRQAIVEHYQGSADWLMPVHVIAGVKRIRARRIEAVALTPPPDMDPDDTAAYQRWLAEERSRVADGLPPSMPPEVGQPRDIRELGRLRDVDDEGAA